MAEIITRIGRDGKPSHQVKIYLGRVNGKVKYKIKTIRGKKSDAEKWAREQETLRDTGKLHTDEKITLREWLEKWLNLSAKRVSAETLEHYRGIVERYVYKTVLGSMPLVKIKTYHVQEFYDQLIDNKLSPRTIEYVHTLVKSAFDQAVGNELISRNPAQFTTRPTKKKTEIVPFTRDQAEAFLDAAKNSKMYVLFVVALTLGLRPEEYCALQWKDIDFEHSILRVERAVRFNKLIYQKDDKGEFVKDKREMRIVIGGGGYYFGDLKTPSSVRKLKLTDKQIELLKMQRRIVLELKIANIKQWQENDLCFPTEAGTPWRRKNLTDRHFSKIIKAAGLEGLGFNLYSLRHSYATLNLLAGTDINTISANLGHTKPSFTMDTYTHVIDEMRLRASEKIDDIFFRPRKEKQQTG